MEEVDSPPLVETKEPASALPRELTLWKHSPARRPASRSKSTATIFLVTPPGVPWPDYQTYTFYTQPITARDLR